MSTVNKAEPGMFVLRNEYVRQVAGLISDRSDPEKLAAAEIALMELALGDLDRNKDKIEAQWEMYNRNVTKKLARAYAKTVLNTRVSKAEGDPVKAAEGASLRDLNRQQWVRPHTRGGTSISGYFRALAQGEEQTEATREAIEEVRQARRQERREQVEERVVQPAREAGKKGLLAGVIGAIGMDSLAESLVKGQDNMKGAAQAFLKENRLTQGVVSVADYFVNKGSKFRFFAQAVRDYGPIVAVQMANVYFRYGGYDVPLKGNKTEFGDNLPPKGASREEVHNWAVNTLRRRLPTEESHDAGAKPPSEGFIVDKKGNIIAHGVGRGIDHFLPFSARHLRKLRKTEGGEFIRRRMLGGPTVEDLHAAMMMGADRLTVVSKGGVFTVELTGRSHGLRLEHMQVLGRFQAIMDREESENNNKRDHGVYARAMSLIQDEFPLHFNVDASRDGADWADRHDYIQPRTRFRDQISRLFDAFSDDRSESEGRPSGTASSGRDIVRDFDPHRMPWKQAFRTGVERGSKPENVLSYLAHQFREEGREIPQSLRAEIRRVREMKEGGTTSSPQQTAKPVAPRDPALVRASRGDTVDWSRFGDEAAIADDLGISISTRSGRQGERVLETIGRLDEKQLAVLANHVDTLKNDMAHMEDMSELPDLIEELAGRPRR